MSTRTFENPLFIDIETVSSVQSYEALSPAMQKLWKRKASTLGYVEEEEQIAAFFERAGIYAEFGKVVTIALGYIESRFDMEPVLRVRGLIAPTEKELFTLFLSVLRKFPENVKFCGHNIKEFDLPYLCRRLVIHGVKLPSALDTAGKKPWEVQHIDTMELWKFGDRKSYTSLDLLANILGIPSSKQGIDGSQVNTFFYEKKDMESIQHYCMEDVVVTAQVYRRLMQHPLLNSEKIEMKK